MEGAVAGKSCQSFTGSVVNPYGCQILFQLLHLPSSSVLLTWKSSRELPMILGPCIQNQKFLVPSFIQTHVYAFGLFGEWTSIWKSILGLSLSLSKICLLNKNKSIFKKDRIKCKTSLICCIFLEWKQEFGINPGMNPGTSIFDLGIQAQS